MRHGSNFHSPRTCAKGLADDCCAKGLFGLGWGGCEEANGYAMTGAAALLPAICKVQSFHEELDKHKDVLAQTGRPTTGIKSLVAQGIWGQNRCGDTANAMMVPTETATASVERQLLEMESRRNRAACIACVEVTETAEDCTCLHEWVL